MKSFRSISFLQDGGYISVSYPGFRSGDKNTYVFAQSSPVLRLTRGGTTSKYAIVTLTAGGKTFEVKLSFEHSVVAEVDISVISQMLAQRTAPSATMAMTGVPGAIAVEVFNYSDVSFGGTKIDRVYYCDATDSTFGGKTNSPYIPVLPEKIVLPAYYTSQRAPFCAKAYSVHQDSNVYFRTETAAGTLINMTAYENRGEGVGINIQSSIAYIKTCDNNGNVYQSCRIERKDCTASSVLLVWWSFDVGGYKSYLADVKGVGDAVSEIGEYREGFVNNAAKTSNEIYNVRFENLTFRDYCYVRDLFVSDYVVLVVFDNISGSEMQTERSVTVKAGDMVWKLNDIKDLDFEIKLEEEGVLW